MEKIIEKLPEIVSAVAQPLEKTQKIVFVNCGNNNDNNNIHRSSYKANQEILTHVAAEVPEILSALQNVNFAELLRSVTNGPLGPSVMEGAVEGAMGALVSNSLTRAN